jgi:NADH dehydrogenase FAD-containing subunit
MSSTKSKLETTEESSSTGETRYLKDGRTMTVENDDTVEIRSAGGMLEVRILLTEAGPVLQMESARLSLKATESVEIEGKRVDIRATEAVTMASEGKLEIKSKDEMRVEGESDVRVVGKMIWLN